MASIFFFFFFFIVVVISPEPMELLKQATLNMKFEDRVKLILRTCCFLDRYK